MRIFSLWLLTLFLVTLQDFQGTTLSYETGLGPFTICDCVISSWKAKHRNESIAKRMEQTMQQKFKIQRTRDAG